MVRPEDVWAAYRLILGRDPESDAVVTAHLNYDSVAQLRQVFLGSFEFQNSFRAAFVTSPSQSAAALPLDGSPAFPVAATDISFLQTCDPHVYFDMLAASSQSVRQYCKRNNHGYEVYIGIKQGCFPWHACFNRIFLFKELWERGFRGWLVYLDADSIVVDQNFDLTGYLHDKGGFAAILTGAAGDELWWNVNNGTMILNYSHPWTGWFIGRYHAMFMEHCYPRLREAADWGAIPHDQDLLHLLLRGDEGSRSFFFLEGHGLLNYGHDPAVPPLTQPFVRQILRQHGSVQERTAIVAAKVSEIVPGSPATWSADLFALPNEEPGTTGDRQLQAARSGGGRNGPSGDSDDDRLVLRRSGEGQVSK